MPNRVLDKILLLTKNWSLIGTKKYPVKRLGQESLDRLQDEIGIVEVPKSANLCRGARRGGKSFDGKLGGHPALWFAHDSKLCKEENRERVFFYRPKHRLRLLDLREADGQAGHEKTELAFDILYGEEKNYSYQRDEVVAAMLYRQLDQAGIHGWIAFDDGEELEVMVLKPKKYIAQKFAGHHHKRLTRKKRDLNDGRDV